VAQDPEAGFPPDFVRYLKPHLAELKRRGIRVASNAGGVNPRACKLALEAGAAELGVPLRVAIVEGDDLMGELDALREQGVREWVSGAILPRTLSRRMPTSARYRSPEPSSWAPTSSSPAAASTAPWRSAS
jgi:Acyclic terpene utilisation family protein AtuA